MPTISGNLIIENDVEVLGNLIYPNSIDVSNNNLLTDISNGIGNSNNLLTDISNGIGNSNNLLTDISNGIRNITNLNTTANSTLTTINTGFTTQNVITNNMLNTLNNTFNMDVSNNIIGNNLLTDISNGIQTMINLDISGVEQLVNNNNLLTDISNGIQTMIDLDTSANVILSTIEFGFATQNIMINNILQHVDNILNMDTSNGVTQNNISDQLVYIGDLDVSANCYLIDISNTLGSINNHTNDIVTTLESSLTVYDSINNDTLNIISNKLNNNQIVRQNVSNLKYIFDINFLYGLYRPQNIILNTSGSGNITLGSSTVMAAVLATTTINDMASVSSKQFGIYQYNKTFIIKFAAIFNASTNDPDIVTMGGYFDNNNGFFFKYTNSTFYVSVKNNSYETSVQQSDWNNDVVDGSGPSSLTIDSTALLCYYIEFTLYGSIIFGIIVNNILYIVHIVSNCTIINTNLSISFKILQNNNGPGSMNITNAALYTNDNYDIIGHQFSLSNFVNKSISNSAPDNYIFGIKIDDSYPYVFIKPNIFTIFTDSVSTNCFYKLYLFKSVNLFDLLTDPSFNQIGQNTSIYIDYNVSVYNTDLDPIVISSGFFNQQIINIDLSSFNIQLHLNDFLMCVCTVLPSAITANIYTSLSWLEYY